MVFFPFHAPVLEPNLDLALREAERVGDLHPPAPRQVAVVVKFFLQLQDLLASVGGPRALGLPAGVIGVYFADLGIFFLRLKGVGRKEGEKRAFGFVFIFPIILSQPESRRFPFSDLGERVFRFSDICIENGVSSGFEKWYQAAVLGRLSIYPP